MTLEVTTAGFWVRDVDRGVERYYTLGEGYEVFRAPVVVGSDPSCEVVIDHPAVRARAAEFEPKGHHFYQRELPDGEWTRRPDPIRIGPYEVSVGWGRPLEPSRGDEPVLPVRFGARSLARGYTAPPTDPRVVEARRLAAAFAQPQAIDPAWCEERVRIFCNALTWATTPRRSLDPGRIHYTPPELVAERYARAWSTVDAATFDRSAFAHVHRLDLWACELLRARGSDYVAAAVIAGAIDTSAWPAPLQRVIHEIAALHLMTLDDDVSPARPLAILLERGVVPVALPDGALALCTPAAVADARERELAGALADPAGRTIYADYLEQLGEPRYAQRLHAGATPNPALAALRSVERFSFAPTLIGERAGERDRNRSFVPTAWAARPPAATLELSGTTYALGIAMTLAADDRIVLRAATGTDDAMITHHADGALWLHRGRDYVDLRLNQRALHSDDAMPLFDGDVIMIESHKYGRDIVKATATLHDP